MTSKLDGFEWRLNKNKENGIGQSFFQSINRLTNEKYL